MEQKENSDAVLNETIDKLDYLEKKITNIMEKNDQLRSMLKKDGPMKSYASNYFSRPIISNSKSAS